MLSNYGCEITISVTNSTPVLCLLDVHPERRVDIQRENSFQTSPPVPSTTYIDGFGNRCRRFIAPPGALMLRIDGTIMDGGNPDPVAPEARETPVEHLPEEVLVFLLGSRYCETEESFWFALTGMAAGAGRLRLRSWTSEIRVSICSVHPNGGRGLRGAHRSVPRLLALDDCFLPMPQYTGTLRQRLPWRHRRATGSCPHGFQRLGGGVPRKPLVHL